MGHLLAKASEALLSVSAGGKTVRTLEGMDHTDAIRALDRLQREQDILAQMRETPVTEKTAATHYGLMAQQAKRVRSASNLVVRAFARLRDQLQPKEGTSE